LAELNIYSNLSIHHHGLSTMPVFKITVRNGLTHCITIEAIQARKWEDFSRILNSWDGKGLPIKRFGLSYRDADGDTITIFNQTGLDVYSMRGQAAAPALTVVDLAAFPTPSADLALLESQTTSPGQFQGTQATSTYAAFQKADIHRQLAELHLRLADLECGGSGRPPPVVIAPGSSTRKVDAETAVAAAGVAATVALQAANIFA
jgi:hypothetical protein